MSYLEIAENNFKVLKEDFPDYDKLNRHIILMYNTCEALLKAILLGNSNIDVNTKDLRAIYNMISDKIDLDIKSILNLDLLYRYSIMASISEDDFIIVSEDYAEEFFNLTNELYLKINKWCSENL